VTTFADEIVIAGQPADDIAVVVRVEVVAVDEIVAGRTREGVGSGSAEDGEALARRRRIA